jgi:monoamine oxidase
MSSSCRIAIVGGGLAGLAAAQALTTFGVRAEVFEAAPALGEIGAAVNVSPQAVKALQAIGVGDKIAAVAHLSPGIYTRNMQTGEFLEFNDRIKTATRYGAPITPFIAPTCWTRWPAGSTMAAFIWDTASRGWRSEATVSFSLSTMARRSRPSS